MNVLSQNNFIRISSATWYYIINLSLRKIFIDIYKTGKTAFVTKMPYSFFLQPAILIL